MKTLLKVVGVLAGIVVVVVAAAVIIVPLVVDPNEYKDKIASAVKEQTGRDLSIVGDINLSVSPFTLDAKLELGEISLGNAPGFPGPHFAKLERAEVRVKLLPLLGDSVEMDTVTIDGLSLNLVKNADGVTNWDDLTARTNDHAAPSSSRAAAAATALAVEGVRVSNAAITWQDDTAGHTLKVQNVSMQTGSVALDRPLEVALEFDIEGLVPGLTGHVATSVTIAFDLQKQQYQASAIKLDASLSGGPLGDEPATIVGTAERGTFDVASQQAMVTGLELQAQGVELAGGRGDLQLTGTLAADLAAQVFDLSGLEVAGKIAGGPFAGGHAEFEGAVDLRADLATQSLTGAGLRLSVRPFVLEGVKGELAATGELTGNLAEQRFTIDGMALTGRAAGERVGGGSVTFELDAQADADVASQRFGARGLVLKGLLTSDKVPDGEMPIDVTADAIVFDVGADAVTIEGLALSAGPMQGKSGKLVVGNLSATPSAQGDLALEKFNPRLLMEIAGQEVPATSDPKALTSATLNVVFAATEDRVDIEPLRLVLDGATLEGSAKLEGFDNPAIGFDISVDALDVDRYLPPKQDKVAASPAAAAPAALQLPIDTLRALNVDGRLRAGKLKISNVQLSNLNVGIKANGGVIALAPLKANLYGGSYTGKIALDASGAEPSASVSERLSKVRLDQLLDALDIASPFELTAQPSDLAVRFGASGDVAKQQFRITGIAINGDVGARGFPGKRFKFKVRGGADVDLAAESLALHKLMLGAFGGEIVTDITAQKFLSDPAYAGTLQIVQLNPRRVLAAIGQPPPKTADPKALTALTLSAKVDGNANRLKLDELNLKLDQTTVTGHVNVKDLTTLASSFRLKVDELDLDRYLPPQQKKGAATPGAAVTLLPVETLRGLDVDGELSIARLKMSNIRLSNVLFTAKAKDGLVTLHPLSAKLYQGTYSGNVVVDARGKQPKLSLHERLQNVQVGPLLEDYNDTRPLRGLANFSAKLDATGNTEAAVRKTLAGNVDFKLRDGAIRGVDILSKICNAVAPLAAAGGVSNLSVETLLGGVLAAAGSQVKDTGETKFSEFGGTVDVAQGVAQNRDLLMKSPLLRVSGTGRYNLVGDRLDYLANAVLVGSCQGQGGLGADQLSGLTVPVRITGPLADPGYDVQIDKLLAELAGGKQQQQTQQKQQTQKKQQKKKSDTEQIKDLLQEGLKGLFGQ